MKKGLAITVFVLLLGACNNSCMFNIDRYEVITGTDIPKLTDIDCSIDYTMKINTTIFTIDTLTLISNEYYKGLENYIVKNNFLPSSSEKQFLNQEKIPEQYKHFSKSNSLYYKEGKTAEKEWLLLLDSEKGIIIGQIKYLQDF